MATLIYNVTDLQNMQNDLAGDYELANDIDASATLGWNGGLGFLPIGASGMPFTGSLDGKGYNVEGLFINRPAAYEVGLFGQTRGSVLQNVHLVSVNITGYSYVGALIGGIYGDPDPCTITNCTSSGTVTSSLDYVGGLVGWSYTAAISYSSSSCSVVGGRDRIGGLIGYFHGNGTGTITGSFATGSVTAAGAIAGGLVGELQACQVIASYASGNIEADDEGGGFVGGLQTGVTITSCYARGDVITTSYASGFVDTVRSGSTVMNCYSTGHITGVEGRTAGFCSYNLGTITACFWDTETSGQATSDGGTGKTTAQMKQIGTFSGWSIGRTTLSNPTNGYPFLSWQVNQSTPVWFIYGAGGGILTPRLFVPVEDKVALELIRNVEMSAAGRVFVDKEGYLEYDSRYRRII